jgi:hypothetical protein
VAAAPRPARRPAAAEFAVLREAQLRNFMQPDQEKTKEKIGAANTVLDHLYFFSSLAFVLSPVWGYLIAEWTGALVGLLCTFVSSHYWAGIFTQKHTIRFRTFFYSLGLLAQGPTLQYLLLTSLNLFLFFRYTLNTQASNLWLLIILFSSYLIVYLIFKLTSTYPKKLSIPMLLIGFAPLLFNLFFFVNYVFAKNPVVEKYTFVVKQELLGGKYQNPKMEKTTLIYLPQNKYDEHLWFRLFFDIDALTDKTQVWYRFENGLLGFRVMKAHGFKR